MKKIICLMVLAMSQASLAYDNLPKWYPPAIGDLEYRTLLSVSSNTLWFNDEYYKMSPVVKVSTLIKKRGSVRDLKEGDEIGYKMTKINNRSVIDHIYIMPKDEN